MSSDDQTPTDQTPNDPTPTDPAPTDPLALSLQLLHAQTHLSRRLDRELSGYHGVSFSDFVLLFELLRASGHRLRRVELAERVGMSPSGVTRALVPLERIGFVTREPDPRDARVGYAVLTEGGRERVAEMRASADLASDRVFADWSPLQRDQLAESLARLESATAARR